ncbi:MAG TPA: FAD-binding oxidoreductase [Candidatus Paceibacterota bacterium]
MNNLSPWLYELPERVDKPILTSDLEADMVIVGAGVSGLTSAYQILTQTNRSVTLIDASRICHGATGHNAGQLVAEFEMSYKELTRRYGTFMAKEAEEALESSWDILKDLLKKTELAVSPHLFMGANGYGTEEDLYDVLEENALRKQTGLTPTDVYVIPSVYNAPHFPRAYKNLVHEMSRSDIESMLDARESAFIAVELKQKGVLNSALFGEKLCEWLEQNYSERFQIYEHTPVTKVILNRAQQKLIIKDFTITCTDVILCTNGFEHFTIEEQGGDIVDRKLHHNVAGVIGFMGAVHHPTNKPPMAYGYYNSSIASDDEMSDELAALKLETHAWEAFKEDPYIYVTKRPFIYEGAAGNLTCIGGPERKLADTRAYDEDRQMAPQFYSLIDRIKTDILHINEKLDFNWHGLMGFTPTSIRIVGPETRNKHLWYNLGCNGVGIMPAMYGSWKLAQMLNGKHFSPSVFDPQ